MILFVFRSSLYIHFFLNIIRWRNEEEFEQLGAQSSSYDGAMAATELKIPFHLSIPQSFRAKDHGAVAEGISFLLLPFQNHAGLKFMFHLLNFSRNVEISGPYHPIVR
jgi:hypothetical protein